MRYALLVLLLGCTKAEQAKPSQGSSDVAVAPPTKPVAKIRWGCFHSNMPWGNGQQSWTVLYDLDAATVTRDIDETPNTPDGVAPPPITDDAGDGGKHEHTTKPLSPDVVASLRTGAAKVLAKAPYKPEYPVPEGTPCTLELLGAGDASLLRVDKADHKEPDAANAFIQTL